MSKNGEYHLGTTIIERRDLDVLFSSLGKQGYAVIGPTVREGEIIYDEIRKSSDLPVGWTDHQEAGTYRLQKEKHERCFGFNSPPHSWKRLLHPPVQHLWQARRKGKGFTIAEEEVKGRKLAFIGVQACDLHAIEILSKVLTGGPFVDSGFQSRSADIFVVALNCSQASPTCFCTSLGTGPRAERGFDIALTEVVEKNRHYFTATVGSEKGAEVLRKVPQHDADRGEHEAAEEVLKKTSASMGRKVDTTNLKTLLYRSSEQRRWHETAKRCLTCANCTMVCPTCFCTTVEDVTDLSGNHSDRSRKWDSCFTMDFSYIHGGSIRPSVYSRYRQWLTHKFASWEDQFGSSGCVGCGRCITWCPVGIDVTEEIAAIRTSDSSNQSVNFSKEKQ